MDKNVFWGVIFGVSVGIAGTGAISCWVGPLNKYDLDVALKECEKSLPRDQNCVYEFIPEKK